MVLAPTRELPGEPTTIDHIELAESHGAGRDVFTIDERLSCWRQIERSHQWNVERGNRPSFQYKLEMIIGMMGAGKSTYATLLAARFYASGGMVYHNGSFLFGRRISDPHLFFTLIGQIGVHSMIFLDEIHTIIEVGAETSRSQRLWNQGLSAGRKQDARIELGTAEETQVGGRTLRATEDVVIPLRPSVLPGGWMRDQSPEDRLRRTYGLPTGAGPMTRQQRGEIDWRTAKKIELSRLLVYRIKDYPFRPDGLAEEYGINPRRDGQGKRPMYRWQAPAQQVLWAMALCDSFAPVMVGAGMTVDRDAVWEEARANIHGAREELSTRPLPKVVRDGLIDAFGERRIPTNGHITASQIGAILGLDKTAAQIGAAVQQATGIKPHRKNGYSAAELMLSLAKISEAEEEW